MTARLEGHVTIITGAASGIGQAVAKRFIAEGAKVVAFDRSADRLASLAEPFGDVCAIFEGDVTLLADNQRAVELAMSRFGRLDSFVANAGVWDGAVSLAKMEDDRIAGTFSRVFAVNVLGGLLGARAAAPHLTKPGGAIIFTLSNSALYPGGGGPIYVASKHAGVGLVRQLAHELAPDIRVNAVCPGATMTGIRSEVATDGNWNSDLPDVQQITDALPMQRVSKPADHASLYVTLASPAETPVTTGALFEADGGWAARGLVHREAQIPND